MARIVPTLPPDARYPYALLALRRRGCTPGAAQGIDFGADAEHQSDAENEERCRLIGPVPNGTKSRKISQVVLDFDYFLDSYG